MYLPIECDIALQSAYYFIGEQYEQNSTKRASLFLDIPKSI
jgi:hypothetical protein